MATTRTRKPITTATDPATTATAAPLLDLQTLTTRHSIAIDGAAYELRTFDDLSIVDYHQTPRRAARIYGLLREETLTSEQEHELSRLVDQVCRIILDAPQAVHAKLKDWQRLKIFQTFTLLSRVTAPPAGAAAAPAAPVN